MARNYVPPVFMAVTYFRDFMREPDDAFAQSVDMQGNPTPSCMMDAIHLWLFDAEARESAGQGGTHAFDNCPTFETYLLSVPMIIDTWTRQPRLFEWPAKIAKRYRLEPVTTVFPALPEADLLRGADNYHPTEPGKFSHGDWTEDFLRAQYDHPALDRGTFEYLRTMSERAQRRYEADTVWRIHELSQKSQNTE